MSDLPSFPATPKAPKGAPNVIVVLTDDVGFGATSTFGGPIPMPVFDALAESGLRYNRFHTAAMCSPTRAALLTGRNHHVVGFGGLSESAHAAPGYHSMIPKQAATIGRVLLMNGYNTAWFGKNHNTPLWEQTPSGPFDRWPTGLGFEYFYGFIGGATSQFFPVLVENTSFKEAPADPDYILDRDMADRAIGWLDRQNNATPDKPFFLYYAPGTAHSPHQAPADWLDRFAGQFDDGWDAARERTFARQKEMGIIPPDAELTPRPAEIKAWEDCSADEKRLYARMMEVYAAQLAHWDYQFGRVIEHLRGTGQMDNTLVIYVQGDNGASGEGGHDGTLNDFSIFNDTHATVEQMLERFDDIGGPHTFGNYPIGWAWAMNTPFQWMKQVASHFGGTRNGMVVTYPKLIDTPGEVRSQFHHVIDIAPTIYDIVGIEPPVEVEGAEQIPLDGVSMKYSIADRDAKGREEQYFELAGNRGIVKDGWMASTTPGLLPWTTTAKSPVEEWGWELYNLDEDYSQRHDLASAFPDRLAELKNRFEAACETYKLRPINAGYMYGMAQPKPSPLAGRKHFRYRANGDRIPTTAFPDIKNRSWRVDIRMTCLGNDDGMLISQGGRLAGWGLYLEGGHLNCAYRISNDPSLVSHGRSDVAISAGDHVLSMKFRFIGPDAGGPASIDVALDGMSILKLEVPRTIKRIVSEAISIGFERGTTLMPSISHPFRFTGSIEEVEVTIL